MTAIRIAVVGAGGHSSVVIEALRAMSLFTIVGVVDPNPLRPDVLGVPVLGGDECFEALRLDGVEAVVVALGSNHRRQALATQLLAQGFILPPVIHPTALVSPTAKIAAGVVILARAVIGTSAQVGAFAIINTGAIVEHDNEIGVAAHIAPGVSLAGSVHIGDRTLIGVGSAVRPCIWVGSDAIVGAGSAVVSDVGDGFIVAGVPARPLSKRAGSAL